MARPLDKHRTILDAAVRVFAERGFNSCRVADIADAAGVAYGLVYHYFSSKDEILDQIFIERWEILTNEIIDIDSQDLSARQKLQEISDFIIDSYQYNPDVMKVIIVEVTRAVNTFGKTHFGRIGEAFEMINEIVRQGQREGLFRDDLDPKLVTFAFYGVIEQFLTGWIFELMPNSRADFEDAKRTVIELVCQGLENGPLRTAVNVHQPDGSDLLAANG